MILMKDIIEDNNPKIREISKEVELPLNDEDKQLILDMHEFLVNSQDENISKKYDLRPAVGIAAIQLGIPKRMCAIRVCDYDDNGNVVSSEDYGLVNPRIISYTQKPSCLRDGEGCLSVNRNVSGLVKRHAKITVEAYDVLQDKIVTIVARGFLSICMQHELDHLDGILFYDHINLENPLQPIENAMIID